MIVASLSDILVKPDDINIAVILINEADIQLAGDFHRDKHKPDCH